MGHSHPRGRLRRGCRRSPTAGGRPPSRRSGACSVGDTRARKHLIISYARARNAPEADSRNPPASLDGLAHRPRQPRRLGAPGPPKRQERSRQSAADFRGQQTTHTIALFGTGLALPDAPRAVQAAYTVFADATLPGHRRRQNRPACLFSLSSAAWAPIKGSRNTAARSWPSCATGPGTERPRQLPARRRSQARAQALGVTAPRPVSPQGSLVTSPPSLWTHHAARPCARLPPGSVSRPSARRSGHRSHQRVDDGPRRRRRRLVLQDQVLDLGMGRGAYHVASALATRVGVPLHLSQQVDTGPER